MQWNSVSTDGVIVRKVVGSASGRIFLAGQDGNMYEVRPSALLPTTTQGGVRYLRSVESSCMSMAHARPSLPPPPPHIHIQQTRAKVYYEHEGASLAQALGLANKCRKINRTQSAASYAGTLVQPLVQRLRLGGESAGKKRMCVCVLVAR